MRLALLSLGLLLGLATPNASAEPLTITSSSLSRFALLTNVTSFGPFKWRGGIELASANKKFGGLSGLIMTDECTSLRAVSDAGRWLTATVDLQWGHAPRASSRPPSSPSSMTGKTTTKQALWRYGSSCRGVKWENHVGFESRTRVGAYDLAGKGMTARFKNLNPPRTLCAAAQRRTGVRGLFPGRRTQGPLYRGCRNQP